MERENGEIYSKVIRAGKRTYFFDIKSTKGKDLYVVLTESKKNSSDGRESFEKHKIFLYKEDFEKFQSGLEETLEKVKEIRSKGDYKQLKEETVTADISFEDL
ncbi:MAG: DUF3276 family protein [Crocinitomicaceae bacterium]